jgi:predicted nuclease of predicted toxin-antitoxin system
LISLLLDQGLPRSAVAILTSKGHDVLHVADLGLDEAKDMEIRNMSMKMRHFHKIFSVPLHRSSTMVC